MKIKLFFVILVALMVLITSCGGSQSVQPSYGGNQPSYNPPSQPSSNRDNDNVNTPSEEIACSVEDRGSGYYCLDKNGEEWAWKQKTCDPTREYIITERVSCINNRCQKDETIIRNCKDFGPDWVCGYRTSAEEGDTVCTKPDWSEIKDV